MTNMHDPRHPGEVLSDWLTDITVIEAQRCLVCQTAPLRSTRKWTHGYRRRSARLQAAGTGCRPTSTCGMRSASSKPTYVRLVYMVGGVSGDRALAPFRN